MKKALSLVLAAALTFSLAACAPAAPAAAPAQPTVQSVAPTDAPATPTPSPAPTPTPSPTQEPTPSPEPTPDLAAQKQIMLEKTKYSFTGRTEAGGAMHLVTGSDTFGALIIENADGGSYLRFVGTAEAYENDVIKITDDETSFSYGFKVEELEDGSYLVDCGALGIGYLEEEAAQNVVESIYTAFGGMEDVTEPFLKMVVAQTVSSEDGDFTVMLPSEWQQVTDYSLHDNAQLQAQNKNETAFFLMVATSKEDVAGTFDEWAETNYNAFTERLGNVEVLDTAETYAGGNDAAQIVFSGDFNNTKLKYLITFIEGENYYAQALSWCVASGFDANLSGFVSTVRSITGL